MENNVLFEKYNIDTVNELLYEFLPKGYNVPVAFLEIKDVALYPEKSNVTVFGYIDSYEIMPTKGKISKVKGKLYNNGQFIYCYWTTIANKAKGMIFGLENASKNGQLIQVSGKIGQFSFDNGTVFKYLDQPKISSVNAVEGDFNQSVIIPEPLYVLKDGMKANVIKNSLNKIVNDFDLTRLDGLLPKEIEEALGYTDILTAFKYTHGMIPVRSSDFSDFVNYNGYRRRLQLEKIWEIMKRGNELKNKPYSSTFMFSDEDYVNVKHIMSKLKFELTGDQKKAIWSIFKNIEAKDSSKSLVFGDVGSGKTLVALILSYVLYKRGYQVAILTPTSILSKQHFLEAKELFEGESVFIVHSKTKKKEKDEINSILEKGDPAILIGTSSLNKLNFSNLGLVVIDEEQKFGVKDKELLYESNDLSHVVLMTATPIPRTLASAIFTDYVICKIEQKPALQKPRITQIKNVKDMSDKQISFIKAKINAGEQILVIVPSIVSNDMVNVESATAKYKKIFPEFIIDSIHGNLKDDQKEERTDLFMEGKSHLLIATTMVDSGFSNKNLSFVFIENSERFGISQLHQIRGRVGRAEKQGYCFLSTLESWNNLKEGTKRRLNGIVESENGFELSLKDMELRGSGDVLGLEQSGSDVNLNEWQNEIFEISKYFNKNKGNIED